MHRPILLTATRAAAIGASAAAVFGAIQALNETPLTAPFEAVAHAAPPAPEARPNLGPGCVRVQAGGPTSCKAPNTWLQHARNTCVRQQKVLGESRTNVACADGRFREVDFTCCAPPESSIPIHAGGGLVAAWNAAGRQAEPGAVEVNRAWGYEIPPNVSTCGPNHQAFAFFYLKSAEDFVPVPGAAVKIPGRDIAGFERFQAALREHRANPDELVLRFSTLPLVTPAFPGSPEERLYGNGRVGTYYIRLGRHPLVRGSLREAPLTMTIDYHDAQNCFDDEIRGVTAPAPVEDDSVGAPAAIRAIARAFLDDVNGRRLQLTFDSFQPAIVDQRLFEINERGRHGAYFTIGSGAIRVVP